MSDTVKLLKIIQCDTVFKKAATRRDSGIYQK